MTRRHLEYIKVKKNNRNYRIYLKDIKGVVRIAKRVLPPVPIFEEKIILPVLDKKGVEELSTNTRDSVQGSISASNSFDFEDSMEFEPFEIVK